MSWSVFSRIHAGNNTNSTGVSSTAAHSAGIRATHAEGQRGTLAGTTLFTGSVLDDSRDDAEAKTHSYSDAHAEKHEAGDAEAEKTSTEKGTDAERRAASGLTEIVVVIAESGSMHGLESDTIGGINALVERNREADGRAYLSTVLFNTSTRVLHDREDIAEAKPLSDRDYRPSGCTALLDAVGGAIEHVDMVQRYMPAGHKADHVLFAIATDGLENASRKFTYKQVKHMIEQHREKGWEFVFLGANIDVAEAADSLGIAQDRAMEYCADSAGTAAAYNAFAEASVNMRTSGHVNADWAAPVARDNARRGKR